MKKKHWIIGGIIAIVAVVGLVVFFKMKKDDEAAE